jgi:DNA-binding MarR family transcriptional regulator
VSNNIDRGVLRHVGLTAWDINTINVLVKSGGEVRWHGDTVKPQTKQMLDICVKKNLVELVRREFGHAFLRLTDLGRVAAAQLEAMNAAPKVIVNTTGEEAPKIET